MQQHVETSCALEKPVTPFGEEEKEDNVFSSQGEPTPIKRRKKVFSYQINNKTLPTNDN